MSENEQTRSEERTNRALRMDLLIAVCALLLSAVVATAAVIQTRVIANQTQVIANQLSATVWPYLSFTLTESNSQLRYYLENDGLGPAILRSATLRLDTAPRNSVGAAALVLLHGRQPRHSTLHTSSLEIGEVLRPGQSVEILGFDGAQARAFIAAVRKRVTLSVCYCSLLDQCWSVTALVDSKGPVQVARCTENSEVGA
jgi:hypothetical protein